MADKLEPVTPDWAQAPLPIGKVASNLMAIADQIRSIAEETRQFEQGQPGGGSADRPLTSAARYFREQLNLAYFRAHNFGGAFHDETGWSVLLRLMVARLEQQDLTRQELEAELRFGRTAIHAAIDGMLASGVLESFPDPTHPNQVHLALSGDTARRLTEFYRTREAA